MSAMQTPSGRDELGLGVVHITPRAAVSLGLVVMLLGAMVATAVTWGKMETTIGTKLDCSVAERDFVRKTDMAGRLDAIDKRLTRIEDKLDRLMEKDH